MDEYPYKNNVLARCSKDFHKDLVEEDALFAALLRFHCIGEELDAMKKALFYGKSEAGLTFQNVDLALMNPTQQTLLHALLGMITECAELSQALYGYFSSKPLDEVNLQEELGDLNWYRVLALATLGQTEAANRAQNDAKLEARFGPTFSADRANNRDLSNERDTLEQN